MPRYYFHMHAAGKRYDDVEGCEFYDHEEALCEAMLSERELFADRLKHGRLAEETQFEVQDASGAIVGTVPFPRTRD